ncbi:hypothetical protein OIU74_014084 [Salix koriyanagi]|uniref:Xylanase inhibitor C-terminal domain-containing protein n=1 Tax=Salix koriyanagi TaxID=2511006 RepID=A0A9Q0SYM3_9ROSI|nr:hypothetical protein OIU74_014084 [Salix koriyanagi]
MVMGPTQAVKEALKAEFMKQFSGYPSAPSFMILDSCFNLSGYQEVEIPDIKMYFEGSAELNVDVTGVFYFVNTGASQVCLAIASLSNEDEVGIIGNYQQKNHRVINDTKDLRWDLLEKIAVSTRSMIWKYKDQDGIKRSSAQVDEIKPACSTDMSRAKKVSSVPAGKSSTR